MTPINSDYYATLKRWWQITENRLDFYDIKLKKHQDSVREMQAYHDRKDAEQLQIYEYYRGKLETHSPQKGRKVDVYA